MPDVNPLCHLDDEFMWRWYEIDDHGQTAFQSPKSFFFLEECRRDYAVAIQRSVLKLN